MSNAIAFDTYGYVRKLRDAGVDEAQAAIQAEALVALVEDRLATKQDRAALKRDLAEVDANLRKDLAMVEANLKRDIESIKESRTQTRHQGTGYQNRDPAQGVGTPHDDQDGWHDPWWDWSALWSHAGLAAPGAIRPASRPGDAPPACPSTGAGPLTLIPHECPIPLCMHSSAAFFLVCCPLPIHKKGRCWRFERGFVQAPLLAR
ncbi:MAG: hypothetical protein HQL91_08830 [Magnetococcales bacterium]|nr:hypothetical protein [Magnetococcales bacterium]